MKARSSAGEVIGTPYPRVEGPAKVTGRARYTSDVRLPGQLQGRILRSPWPHARVKRVDTRRAEALEGVHAVLSSANAPRIAWYRNQTRLFDDTVRFQGDEVAAVAAQTEELAEDALRLIEVDYEPLPFCVDFDRGPREEPDVQQRGDVEAGLDAAEVTIAAAYRTQTALHNAMEPHGCVAAWDGEQLTLYESTQGVFAVRKAVAAKLGLAEENVRVITEHMGGGFGAKQSAWKHSVIAALLARHCGRPVQLMLERDAENLAAGNRNATRQRVRLGARRDGTLTAIVADIDVEIGAYDAGGEASDVAGIYHTLYRCPNVRTAQTPVRTHAGPAVAFRAPGYAEGAFALESAVDELARELGLDPIDLRLRNHADVHPQKGKPFTTPDAQRRCYEAVATASGWRSYARSTRGTRRRGIGMAAHDWPGGAGHGPVDVEVRIEDDGGARILTGVQDIGTGTRTALCQIAADALGLPLERISIEIGDTASGLRAPTSAGSATLASLGPAVQAAAVALRSGRGRGRRDDNREDKAIRTFGVQVAEVEVDTATGEVRVLRVVAAHDCGRIVNPLLVDSQVVGGVTQAVGYALLEQRVVDRALGLVLNANLEEYKVPTVGDVPQILDATTSVPDEEANAVGAKGIGEPPIIPTAAAIANAIFDAVGVRLRELPLRRDRLLR